MRCANTDVVTLTDKKYPPLEPEQVQVFANEREVRRPFEKIGIITAEGDSDIHGEASLIKAMKKEAAKLGANGMVLGGYSEATTEDKVIRFFLPTSSDNKHRATAIRLK